jgi:glutathione S-transferase
VLYSLRMNDLVLYVDSNFDSPWAMSAFVAMEEKKLQYTLETKVLSRKDTFAADYRARTRRIPSLRHGEFWLAESSAIAEYLDEAFPGPAHPRLFPSDLKQRAVCRELQAWLRSGLQSIREERPTATLWYTPATAPLSKQATEVLGRTLESLSPLIMEGRATLFEEWCIADLDLSLFLQRLNLNGTPLPPKLKAYAEANWARPSSTKWHALPRPPVPG